MIQVEGRAANKGLRIYRPDVPLETICNTNGPAIVRTMVPCFGLPKTMFKSNTEGNSFKDPKFSFIYGVNARTPKIKKILPFFTVYKYDKTRGEGKVLDDFKPSKEIKLTVPAFTDKYHIRELLLRVEIKNGRINPTDVVLLDMIIDEAWDNVKETQLKDDICNPDAFLTIQANELGLSGYVYMWVTSEDYNVNTGGEALSNIIAISDDESAIDFIKCHRLDFINLLFLIKARYMFDTDIAQRKTAVSSAKAAIMSRNMSHNLGSHVMAYLKQHLSSVQDMIRDNVLSTLFNPEEDITTPEGLIAWNNRCQQIIDEQKEGLSEVALPFLVGLGKFISYLQERQDFIATIATNYIPYFSTVNFKDFIYDELNPDLRYKRHKDRIGLKPDNILLGNIARSEGLARKTNPTIKKEMSDIVLKYRHFDGEPVYEEDGETLIQGSNIEVKRDDLEDMRDFMVSLPGGVVGRQAIFSIVENVIRNAAKHGKWGSEANRNLELTFDRYYKEDIETGKTREVIDYVPEGEETLDAFLKKYYYASMDIDDLCIVTLTDNMAFEPRLNEKGEKATKDDCINLAAIRKALIEAYIDNASVEMLQTNKGIKEMRISAAWLRGIEDDVKINPLYITPDFVFNKKKDKEDHYIKASNYWDHDGRWIGDAPILMVRACADTPEEDYHLQYIFCLSKPKEVAIILSKDQWENGFGETDNDTKRDVIKKHLSGLSWGLFDVDTFLKTRNKSYEFIIVEDAVDADLVNKIRMVSPNRVFLQHEVKDILDIEKEIIHSDYTAITSSTLKQKKVDFFRTLSHFDPSTDEITISDPKTLARVPIFEKQKSKNVNIVDGIAKAAYLYRTHNETEQLFSEYLEATEKYKDAKFVEGITGNNSTDRLVRNEIINDLWLYSHLHAMKTSVGIFDERIFAKIYKKDEADIVLPPLKKLIAKYYKEFLSKNKKDPRLLQIKKAKTYSDIEAITGKDFSEIYGDYLAIAFEKKKVSIFNMIKTADGLDIYGYDGYKKEVITLEQPDGSTKERIKYQSIIKKVAEIKMEDGEIKINKLKEDIGKFDYLTIHQGLLDKIYEQFNIRRDPYQKHQFTKLFYETFCSQTEIIEYQDEQIEEGNVFYLSNLRIHSGRSKPSFADMPQHQPFMQYSAIEHAVMDCKYSLVELLDFARYEDDKSNNDF